MDKSEQFENWLKRMGCKGEIAQKFQPVRNPNTAFIWDQLMERVKPKQEVEYIRNNILIKRLKLTNSPAHQLQLESKPLIKEIEIWKKKKSLEDEINLVRYQINEIETDLDKQTESNQIIYLKNENITKQIRDMNSCTFLLNAKQKQIQKEITDVEEMLTHARNLTPVESDVENKYQVLDTLKECTLHLEKILGNESHSHETQHTVKKRDESGFNTVLASSSFNESASNEILYDLSLLEDKKLEEMLQFLYKYNRHNIWKYVCELNETNSSTLVNSTISNNNISITKEVNNKTSLTKLYATHVEYEIKAIQLKVSIGKLKKEISQIWQSDFEMLKQMTLNNSVEILKNKQEECGLIAAVQYLHKFILQDETHNGYETKMKIREEINNLDKSINLLFEVIRRSVGTFRQIYEIIQQMRSDTCMVTKKLQRFTVDENWTQLLTNDTSNVEVSTFLEFPLEYNRIMQLRDNRKVFVRNLPINCLSSEDYNSNMMRLAANFFSSCLSPPEVMLTNILWEKERLMFLKSSAYTFKRNIEEDTATEFDLKESFINYAIDKLKSMNYSKSYKLSQINTQVREVINLWMEMPFSKFISKSRLLNGLPYQHYENLYDNFYKQL